MATRSTPVKYHFALGLAVLLATSGLPQLRIAAQTPAAAPAAMTSQLGTIKTVSGNALTMATDKGAAVAVTVADGAKVLELAVGSTDLKTAKPAQLTDIAAGDRALVTGKAGSEPNSLTAVRVILMKSSDIAQMQADQQADWKARGMGGIVSAIDPASGAITVTSGTKKTIVNTSSKTIFKRFAGDSVKYQDAKPGTIAADTAQGSDTGSRSEVCRRHVDAGGRSHQRLV